MIWSHKKVVVHVNKGRPNGNIRLENLEIMGIDPTNIYGLYQPVYNEYIAHVRRLTLEWYNGAEVVDSAKTRYRNDMASPLG